MYNSNYCVTLMTALLPTKGHVGLIEFMKEFSNNKCLAIVSSRRFEPIHGEDRVGALKYEVGEEFVAHHMDDFAPQNPSTEEEWNYWKNVVLEFFPYATHFVSSEPYGKKMAEILGLTFVPYDIERNINPVKSTNVRKNILEKWGDIVPILQEDLCFPITFFGQESCGKSTMTKRFANCREFNGIGIHEFARPYLEMMEDKTITDEKMDDIVEGQSALQKLALKSGHPIVFQDTDILSTIGYYEFWNGKAPRKAWSKFYSLPNSFYIVMNDKIPFEPDPLRYGGNVRETTKEYWIELLERVGCDYYVVESTDAEEQFKEIYSVIAEEVYSRFDKIMNFERD